jgi:four helix bundle protein
MSTIFSFKELIVYQKAFQLAMEIFNRSQSFPKEEKYSLTDQIRRSSRSVTTNIAEGWAKKIYPKHFISKMTDALGEEYETEVWLDYALKCNYITEPEHNRLVTNYQEVSKMLHAMINNPQKFAPLK